jgi:hypothetical protein
MAGVNIMPVTIGQTLHQSRLFWVSFYDSEFDIFMVNMSVGGKKVLKKKEMEKMENSSCDSIRNK